MDKKDLCKLLMVHDDCTVPVLCNQENFLLQSNSYKVKQTLPECHIFFKKAEKKNLDGRPRNGMFIAVPLEIKENVIDVSPFHWRVQAVVIAVVLLDYLRLYVYSRGFSLCAISLANSIILSRLRVLQ